MERIKLSRKIREEHFLKNGTHYWVCINPGSSDTPIDTKIARSKLYIKYKTAIKKAENRSTTSGRQGWNLLRDLPVGQELEFDDNSVWKRIE